MPGTTDRFRGVKVEVSELSCDSTEFLVRFTTGQIGSVRRPRDTSRQAVVVVRVARDVEVVGYIPPEHDLPGLGRADYECKALEEVRAQGLAQR